MPPKIIPFTVLAWTPTKRKFKPLSVKKSPPDASIDDDAYSEWSGIHSDDDSNWPPLGSSLSKKPPITQIWPKSPSFSLPKDVIENRDFVNRERYTRDILN